MAQRDLPAWRASLSVALLLPVVLALPAPVVAAAEEKAAKKEPAQQKPARERVIEESAAPRGQDEEPVRIYEEISVTGTLIPRKDLEALSPVVVVAAEEIAYQGTGRVEDLIQSLPQAFPGQNSARSNGATGTATVQLRQLGPNRTLTLLDGRRMASGDAWATAADLNSIPSALVKRVDVLTGGASSVYGADAVAGVVNFVLDTEFEGVRGEVRWNGFQHENDNALAQRMNEERGYSVPSGSTWNHGGYSFNLALGGKLDGGKGHASAFVDYRDIAAIWMDQRDYTNCSVEAVAAGPRCGGSAAWQYGRFIAPGRGDFVLDPRTGNNDTFRSALASDVYNFNPTNFMQRNDRKWSGGAFARYRFSDAVEPYAELQLMDDYSDAQIAPSGNFFGTSSINCDNPMMSPSQHEAICGTRTSGYTSLYIGRRNVEGGNRVDQLRHVNWRLLAGIRGDLSPTWSYDVYGMHANVSSPESYVNDVNAARMADALDVVGTPGQPSTWRCRSGNPGCAPWNVFRVGGVTQEALDYISTVAVLESGTNTKLLNGTIRGDLKSIGIKLPSASEAVEIALAGEYRRESLFVTPDEVFALGLRAGSPATTDPIDGSYTTREIFAEVLVPVVQETSAFRDLSLELGYRFMSYEASGQAARNNSSWKAMLSWTPVEGLRLRGGVNRAVRAPDVRELFTPQTFVIGGSEDICAGPSPPATREECARTGVSAAQYGNILANPARQYIALAGGNPELDVEKADTITAGFVWTPRSIPGLTVAADYYDIAISNAISGFALNDVLRSCASTGDPALCQLIHRDALGTLWLAGGYTVAANQNIGDVRSRGLDVSTSYPWNLGHAGFIAFSLVGSTMLESALQTPLVDYDCVGYAGPQCGFPSPKWRHRARASWNTTFGATFSAGWRYIHGVLNDDASPDPDLGNPALIEEWRLNGRYEIPAYNWFDLAVGYKIRNNARLTLGCNNILDKEPPWLFNLTGFFGTYDFLGRALYANLQFEF